MRHSIVVLMPIISVLLTGCGPMNSNFSCNATAGDSCLTIEQVDAMTRFADDIKPTTQSLGMMKADNNIPNRQGKIIKQNNGQSLWVARNMEEKSWA
ncbi:TPA: TraV family lipoprotein [Legionella pneumophila]|uniref:TraV family lipoprotein n=1 Tax=Legionella pneumophila TaxID=446 RepID=UPI000875BD87|nr:TraV family lipoprotein [Legionella pneumophila]AOW53837.1 conjugal transfer protein [Legionella pneumophila subsp. pneumophila]AOW56738.1 conjugal transfer protein [Legionella pneumophila subsp. pneumophila]AOW65435.1 conjugal transfer protein [Legionella pneumophila subsp. pneumophila]HAT1704502.1 TraV family lipoprotein [Legionella pneumophila]HAT4482138.1 TraV family lipoprotein [Legionella pneumophila]